MVGAALESTPFALPILVASSPEVALSSMFDTASDPPSFTLPISVASSPKVALSSVIGAASDPPSLVDLAVPAADSSVH
eukprot:13690523-Ditylum_brightwellii.AAC.1